MEKSDSSQLIVLKDILSFRDLISNFKNWLKREDWLNLSITCRCIHQTILHHDERFNLLKPLTAQQKLRWLAKSLVQKFQLPFHIGFTSHCDEPYHQMLLCSSSLVGLPPVIARIYQFSGIVTNLNNTPQGYIWDPDVLDYFCFVSKQEVSDSRLLMKLLPEGRCYWTYSHILLLRSDVEKRHKSHTYSTFQKKRMRIEIDAEHAYFLQKNLLLKKKKMKEQLEKVDTKAIKLIKKKKINEQMEKATKKLMNYKSRINQAPHLKLGVLRFVKE